MTPCPLEPWLRLAVAAAAALTKLHQSGLIHQNIRPETLEIDLQRGRVELLDAAESSKPGPLALKLPLGALPYIAPEQTGRIEGSIDHRVDLYSLGVVLYELRAGALPFSADDPIGWVHCHVARAPRALLTAAPGTPDVVSDIVMKLLAKSPDERYQSARGLSHDLERCLAELTEHGRIEPFPLGAQDVWDKLRAASRMFGRGEELDALRAAYERVRSGGGVEVVLVAGPSGIGKSSLLRDLARDVGAGRPPFLRGSFEEQKRDVPYGTLSQAFQALVRQTVAATDDELVEVREQIAGVLGPNGQLIVDLVPEIEVVIGEQLTVPLLPPEDARNRFHMVFRSFLGVFATQRSPLVLLLDDLQWADFESLEVLGHVLAHRDTRSLLLIGAHRDEGVDASHPLTSMLQEVKSAGVPVSTLHLRPLSQDDLVELVVDLFSCELEKAELLAALLSARTSGNPFFAVQLLGALHQEQLIRFDARRWAWQWDIAEIEAKEITYDLVELVLDRLRRLPEGTLKLLPLAACMGREFSVELLGLLCEKTGEETRAALEPALLAGLLLQRPSGFKFLHDRVLAAAYSLISQGERAGLHLRLGRKLLERTPEAAIDAVLFDVVNQMNLGAPRVETASERRKIAELNLRAGRKAKASGAGRSAATYLTAGLSLIPSEDWSSDYPLLYGLHIELAECEYLSGRFDEAEQLCARVADLGHTRVERAAAYRLRMQIATARVDNARAVDAGLQCLRLFGIKLPRDPSDKSVLDEISWVRDKLRERPIEELIDLPEMREPETIAVMEILSALYPAAAYVAPNLAHLAVTRMVRLSILHGNTPASVHGYVTLGNTLCARLGDYHEGYRFGKLACDLAGRPGFSGYTAEAQVIFGATILPWSRHAREQLPHFQQGYRVAQESGKLIYASSALLQNVFTLVNIGEPLHAVEEAISPAREFMQGAKYSYMDDCLAWTERFVRVLRGDTELSGLLSGEGFDKAAFEEHLRSRNIPLVRFWCSLFKLQMRYLGGKYEDAFAAAKESLELLWSGLYTLYEVELFHYGALAAAALYEGASETAREELRGMFSAAEEKLRRWAHSCPDNFEGKHALVAAEIARVEGRDHDAARLYDKAIRASQKSGFVADEGVACELAGRFYRDRAFAIVPEAYLGQARACFERWGATAKVRQLERMYGELYPARRQDSSFTSSAEALPIDTLTAVKASAAISSEMAPSELLATLMRILSEHVGAERACLLLPSPAGLSVAAEITSDHDGLQVDIPKERRAPSPAAFPLTMAHYVRRTRSKLNLDDVTAYATFSADPFLASTHPRSMLCAPIVRRGEVAGILYLENRLVRGAFTPRRLALLEFLSAVSLENALLADDLARETAERAQAEKTLQKSEERLQRLVETAQVVPWEAKRASGRFTYIGPQVKKMLGYPAEAWLEPGFFGAHAHEEDREEAQLHLFAREGDVDLDFRMIAADGRVVWLHNIPSALATEGADVLGGFFFDVTERRQAEATLTEKLAIIEAQKAAIQKLSASIIEVWDGVLTMPVLGTVDEERAEQMMSVMLDAAARTRCRSMIIDLTGVETVDSKTAEHLIKIVSAIRLLGAEAIVVGIRPEVAQTIVSIGVDLSSVVTLANLRKALLRCMRGGFGGGVSEGAEKLRSRR